MENKIGHGHDAFIAEVRADLTARPYTIYGMEKIKTICPVVPTRGYLVALAEVIVCHATCCVGVETFRDAESNEDIDFVLIVARDETSYTKAYAEAESLIMERNDGVVIARIITGPF